MKKHRKERPKESVAVKNLKEGVELYGEHDFFYRLPGYIEEIDGGKDENSWMEKTSRDGYIFLNQEYLASPAEWCYAIAHCKLHLAFGHFDAERMPGFEKRRVNERKQKEENCNLYLWNMACDIFIAGFLADIKLPGALCENPKNIFPAGLENELQIYEYLEEKHYESQEQIFGTGSRKGLDMQGLEKPLIYEDGEENFFMKEFSEALSESIADTLCETGGHSWGKRSYKEKPERAAQWFVDHYPLLGGVASGFQILCDYHLCQREEVQIAAVDADSGIIYTNPVADLNFEEWKFVLAHEFLHAGLEHQARCQGREPYLWNVAGDYVINSWLIEMKIGSMPRLGVLYDEKLKGYSAEEVYDMIIRDIKRYQKIETFRGYGRGDVFFSKKKRNFRNPMEEGVTLDEFYREALLKGMEYHIEKQRGWIPAGLQEEIRTLAMPPIPWDVKLAQWFEEQFPGQEKIRTYVRPSRRQGAMPDIPRPYYQKENLQKKETFGVVLDTSGSMSVELLGKALGSIASYAAVKEISHVRVIFCDASAYDAGYLEIEELTGRIEVKGRGGTRLQPGVDLLENAKDFPKDGPILLLTDGMIEHDLKIQRKYAFLIPKGRTLPFCVKGKVFYME